MPRGGARNRSGPQPDENSLKSAKIGYSLTALPSQGYDGAVPDFPLAPINVYYEYFVGKEKIRKVDDTGTQVRAEREQALWAWAWSLPQACAWSLQPWRWHAVAMWVRTAVLCETADATAADKNSLHRFADQIGLTPAGLKENGWKIAADEVAQKRAEQQPPAPTAPSTRSRLASIKGGRGA